jgi:hypothetical protein
MKLDNDYEETATNMKAHDRHPIGMWYMNEKLKVCRFRIYLQHTQVRSVIVPLRRIKGTSMR